jgi:PIN domain nuclease of toxin-antitoxin system
VTTVLLDTHVVHWWSAEPAKLSKVATRALKAADELAVSAITWYELAWLARHGRIILSVPVGTWLHEISRDVRTFGISPAIADTATALPGGFPGDPADRIIYATAIEEGCSLVTKDRSLRGYRYTRPVAVW